MRNVLIIILIVISFNYCNSENNEEFLKNMTIGKKFLDNQQYKASLEYFSRANYYKPSDPVPYYYSGMTFIRLKNYDRSINAFTKALELYPEYKSALHGRSTVYILKESYDKAIKDISKLIEIDASNYLAYHNKGIVLFKQNKFKLASKNFQKVLFLNKNYQPSLQYLIKSYREDKQYKKALEHCDKILEISPNDYITILMKSIIHSDKGETGLSNKYFKQLTAIVIQNRTLGNNILKYIESDKELFKSNRNTYEFVKSLKKIKDSVNL